MITRISSELHARLLALAAAEPGREVCGLVFGSKAKTVRAEPVEALPFSSGQERAALRQAQGERIIAVEPARNIAANPSDTFEIDPAPLFAALKAERAGGPRLIGHYHSHPSGAPEPSARDARQALDAGRLWLIVGAGRVAAWRAVPGGSIHGAFEPVTLLIAPDSCETGHTSPQGPARGA